MKLSGIEQVKIPKKIVVSNSLLIIINQTELSRMNCHLYFLNHFGLKMLKKFMKKYLICRKL